MLKLWLLTLFLCAGALVEANRGGQRVKLAEKEASEHDQVKAQEHDRKILKATNEHNKLKEHVDQQKFQKHGVKVVNYHRDTLKDDRKNEVLYQHDHDKKVEIKRDRKLKKTKLNIDDCSSSGGCSHSGGRSSKSCSGSGSGSHERCKGRRCGCGWPWGWGQGWGHGGGCHHGWHHGCHHGSNVGCHHKWCDWCIKKLSHKYWNLFHKMCRCPTYTQTNSNGDQCICVKDCDKKKH